MAEIKSTMELVLERAARMGKASSDELEREEARRRGMRLAAAFLDGKGEDPEEMLAREDAALQREIRQGMAEALLRNVFLPRDEHARARVERAAQGVVQLAGGAGDVSSICREMLHITGQYDQHRDQLRRQLEEQVRMQLEQVVAQQLGGQASAMEVDAAIETKIREEWARVEGELEEQYGQALEQHRNLLRQRLGLSA